MILTHVHVHVHAITVAYIITISFIWNLYSLSSGLVVSSDDRLAVVVEELQDLKGVWVELGKIWEQIDELRDKPWLSVQPRKVI